MKIRHVILNIYIFLVFCFHLLTNRISESYLKKERKGGEEELGVGNGGNDVVRQKPILDTEAWQEHSERERPHRFLHGSSLSFSLNFLFGPSVFDYFVFDSGLNPCQENGTRPEYQLAPEGVSQAKLAGQLFQKVQFWVVADLFLVNLCFF